MKNLANDKSHFSLFGGADATVTTKDSVWQLGDQSLQIYKPASLAGTGEWSMELYRFASEGEMLNFKISPKVTYFW
jgi:hypothetical protein